MGRKKIEINPECGKRLSQLLAKYGIKQKELAQALNYTPQQISRIVTGRDNFTEEFASKVVEYFKSGNLEHDLFEVVRLDWLMCRDNFQTEGDRMDSFNEGRSEIKHLIMQLIKLHGYEITAKEFPVNTERLTPEEFEEYQRKPYRNLKYGLESHRPDRTIVFRVLDHSEIDRIFLDIDDFVEFICRKNLDPLFNRYLHLWGGANHNG